MDLITVILAGGGGTRFWPLSRQNKPKQLLNLSGNDIMLNDTILRYESVIPLQNTVIVTNQMQAELINKILLEQVPRENVLKEPAARNTAACILYAALFIKKKYQEAVMTVLPSDHYFTDVEGFRNILKKACDLARQTDKLITIGIKPAFPATGYGYIHFNKENQDPLSRAYEVTNFVEKPTFEKAKEFVDSGNYLWNSGMFAWKVSVILDNYRRYLPRLYKNMMEIYDYLGTGQEAELLNRIYGNLQNISIDYGILERSDEVLVIPGDFGWNDVGSWDALGAIFPSDNNGNIVKANHLGIDTKNSIIYGNDQLIATIGIENLIVAVTGDAILICPKNKAQNVKDLVELLKERGLQEFI
ncbi:MAG: mannose-1-phosphate guanylyltransferase [Firmicutes bacterium]|nr:mannose-1-phosphate guanylyltransferase [Bacillota bacterium]